MAGTPLFSQRVADSVEELTEFGVSALAGLFDLTSERLVRYAVTITRNLHDAEDAVQAVLVRVAGRSHLLRQANSPWSYLLRMVRNEALAIARRKKRWALVTNLSDLLTRHFVDEVEQEDTRQAVWRALRLIPTPQAEVVVLKIWEELTFAEIAQLLGVSPHTAASRYQYAMQKLSRRLHTHLEVRHD